MAYPSTPRDAQNIPIGCVYVPGVGFVATQGGSSVNTDVNGNASAPIVVSGTVTAANPSVGANGSAIPASSTLIGASDGTNEQPLQVESSSNKNLRIAAYNGTNELAIDGSGNASVKLGAALPAGGNTIGNVGLVAGSAVVGGVELVDSAGTNKAAISAGGALKVDNSGVVQTVAGSVTANIGTSGSLALETGGNLATLAGAVSSSKVQANVAQMGGVATSMGNGTTDTGTQRVTLSSDSTGTVVVTQATSSNLKTQTVGAVASGSSNSGNPVKVAGVFNATQPTVTNAQIVDLQATSRGAAIVATGADTFNVTVNAALPAGANTVGNVGLVAGSALIGSIELVDSGGTNKASISAGGAIKVDNSGVTQPISGTVTANSGASATSTLSNVSAATSSTSILASNGSRKAMYLYNDSSSAMYLKFGATASTTSFTVKVPANNFFEMPTVPIYTGAITAVWDTATGTARITELT